jgi:hypothetical protein
VASLEDLREGRRDWRWTFLGVLAQTACVSSACLAAGVTRDTAYRHRERFPRFRAKWDEALEVSVELLEACARSRALDRSDRFGHVLLQFLLRAHRPEKYRDGARGAGSNAAAGPDSIDTAAAAAALKAAREAAGLGDGDRAAEPGGGPGHGPGDG